jgi:hypothetical protein
LSVALVAAFQNSRRTACREKPRGTVQPTPPARSAGNARVSPKHDWRPDGAAPALRQAGSLAPVFTFSHYSLYAQAEHLAGHQSAFLAPLLESSFLSKSSSFLNVRDEASISYQLLHERRKQSSVKGVSRSEVADDARIRIHLYHVPLLDSFSSRT